MHKFTYTETEKEIKISPGSLRRRWVSCKRKRTQKQKLTQYFEQSNKKNFK